MSGRGAKRKLFTIGHSNLDLARFVTLLSRHGIDAIADVRSQPYSGRNPQFNKDSLERALSISNITYVFLGDELGGRAAEFVNGGGAHRYQWIARTEKFAHGLQRVREGARKYRLAIMCAENDPLKCHRAILICRHLRDDNLEIAHILTDGSLEPLEAAESRLLELAGLTSQDLFRSREELIHEAYEWQSARIAYPSPEFGSAGP